jgi:hypothetical protein
MAEQNGASEAGRGPDYGSPEYKAYRRAVDKGDVSFHQVASAWFDWHWGPDDCQRCFGTGWTVAAATVEGDSTSAPVPGGSAATATVTTVALVTNGAAVRTRCATCQGRGRHHRIDGRASAYEEIFHELLETFSEQRGGLITAYFCENIRVAAALTDIWSAADRADGPVRTIKEVEQERAREEKRNAPERLMAWFRDLFREKASNTAIHIEPTFGDPDSPRAKQILFRCLKVHYQALEYLKPKPRKICMRMTFNVITMLLGTLDNRIGRGEPASAFDQSHADQRTLEHELESTEAYYLTAVRRQARIHYMLGMLIGLPLAGGVAYVLYMFHELPVNMSIAFAAGAAGALVSVMERLTSGKLDMNHEAGRAINVTLGLMRPFIGALFAVALFFFIQGDLVSVFQLPDVEQAQRYFFAGIGFLAGFSERFAQDMVAQGKVAGVAQTPSMPTATAR